MPVLKVFFAAFYALIIAWSFDDRSEEESIRRRWSPLYDPLYILWVLGGILVVMVLIEGAAGGGKVAAMGFSLFCHTLVYYALLLAVLPLLRRFFTARACAALWLLPNFLIFAENSAFQNAKPFLLIDVSKPLALALLLLWAAGAAGVLLWQLAAHLRFRRQLLRDAVPVDGPVSRLWEAECRRAEYKKPLRLLRSPATVSPVSIGLTRRSLRVLLPEREYTEEELTLIFRHELYHCRHMDIGLKFFLTLCTAAGWFNPLLWIARRKASDDLELGCDEEVLRHARPGERKRYAQLILSSAADERGFTSCLSASAGALRYRLARVMEPGRRFSGGVLIGVLAMVLLLSYGLVDVSLEQPTVGEVLDGLGPGDIDRVLAYNLDEGDTREVYAWDERFGEAFTALPLRSVSRSYDFDYTWSASTDPCLDVYYASGMDWVWVEVYGEYVYIYGRLGGEFLNDYYVPGGELDWPGFAALLDFDAENPTPAKIPHLTLRYDKKGSTLYGSTHYEVLSASAEGYAGKYNPDTCYLCGSLEELPGSVELVFSLDPQEWSVLVEPYEGQAKMLVATAADCPDYRISLEPCSARYTVRGSFVSSGVTLDMVFYFDVVLKAS